jgi:hypothetical protein
LAIPLCQQFSVRYLLRTGLLQRITEYAQPVVLSTWEDAVLQREMEAAGIEVHPLPRVEYGRAYQHLLKQLDLVHLKRVQSPTTAMDARRNALLHPISFRRRVRDTLYRFALSLPGYASWLREAEAKRLRSATNLDTFLNLLRGLRTDAVFTITPFLRDEHLFLRAAHELRMPLAASILSFDNLTTRGWIPVIFDLYMVWNTFNQAEVTRVYPEAAGRTVEIVGAPQMDFYRDASYLWPEAEWRAALALPAGRPVILFGGGPTSIVPNEPGIVLQLDQAIESGEIRGQPVLLLRPHPHDTLERWSAVLKQCRRVVCDEPWRAESPNRLQTNVSRRDIEKLASTLKHSAVHVNTSSTMTIDGALFDRPQIGPAYDDTDPRFDRAMKELYEREHFLPIVGSGGLTLAHSRGELVAAVNDALANPARGRAERQALVRRLITFDDGQSTKRVADGLRKLLTERR